MQLLAGEVLIAVGKTSLIWCRMTDQLCFAIIPGVQLVGFLGWKEHLADLNDAGWLVALV
jgi:hypothetical protein